MTTDRTQATPTRSLLAGGYRGATIGSFALVFLAAFEALAVATVMPTVSRELDGRAWFAAAFSAALAASLVGMVVVGLWADRRGAVRPLLAAVALFGLGLLAAGLAPTMPVLVAGRVLQGLGGGGLTVALYVLVAQVYDDVDRPRILGAFAAAWVLPGSSGPSPPDWSPTPWAGAGCSWGSSSSPASPWRCLCRRWPRSSHRHRAHRSPVACAGSPWPRPCPRAC